ncbi:MAG: putative RNA uridine N3 methyltransferase, partial [Candidatus Thorarchaeota archaeon]
MTLEVAIPDTSLEDCSSLREKTVKIGQLARGFAVFKVEKVLVYRTEQLSTKSRKDFDLLVKLLRYMDIPQYLRQRIFSHSPSLKFAGLLPPLRTRSHPLAVGVKDLTVGDVRWGIQVRKGSIDLGLDRPFRYHDSVSERIPTLFRVRSASPSPQIEVIEREDVEYYFGFEVTPTDDLIGV